MKIMQKPTPGNRNYAIFIYAFLLLIGLYWTSNYSYLLFHSLAELFSVVVACGIFMLAWNSRRILDNSYFLYIGIAYLFIGALDLSHTLAYKGMGVFPGSNTNLPTQLWIATRYMESITLLMAPLFIGRKLNIKFVFGGYLTAGFFLLGSIFYWNIFPQCFVEGAGLTSFKKASEFIISTILSFSIVIMFRKRHEFDASIYRLLIASVTLTILSELAFTFYIHAYGLSNLLGHFLKIVSFYLIYRAVIVTGLTKPYAMLFRNLKEHEDALHKAHGELEIRVQERTAELAQTNVFLENEIVERKRTEEALRLDEARLEALVKLGQYTEASLKEIADFVLEAGVALTKSEIGFIGFMNDAETDMTIHAWSKSAMSQCSIIDKPLHFAIEKAGLWGDAVTKREPVIINDYALPNSKKKGYPNGHVKLSRLLNVPVLDRGKIVAIVGMANKEKKYDKSDIRQLMLLLDGMWRMIQHKIMQEQLRQSKTMLQTVFDGIIDPIILLGKNMEVKIINQAAVEYYGVPLSQETIGKQCYEVFKKRTAPCHGCEVPQAILEGQNTAFEREGLIHPDRSERVFIYLLKGETGAAEDAILRVSDITERKQFEKQIIQNEKMASLGVLVSSMAHEINNPNNFISFNLPILKDYLEEILPIVDRYAEKTRDFELCEMTYPEFRRDVFSLLKNIEHGSQRITKIVSNLKVVSRNDKSKDMKWVDLKTVVENALTICRAKITKMVKSLTVTMSEDLPQIYTNPNAIEHIMINLLINAAQAADKEESWIEVRVKQCDTRRDHIIIEVCDNGCGIEEKDQKHIYDPFFTTKPVGEGTGLGLYVCHTLVEEIFGQIEFESEPGQGSGFKVTLRDTGPSLEKRP